MTSRVTPLIASLLLIACAAAPAGDSSAAFKVADLAHQGYWLKDRTELYERAMAMLEKPAPDLKLAEWEGTAVTPQAMKGKVVLIDFWATWCGPCIAQIPHANAISKKYAGQGVVVMGACDPKGAETMSQTVKDKGMKYPTGKLSAEDVTAWKIAFWPTYAVIDRGGKLRAIGLEPDYVEKVLDAVLAEQPTEKAK